jgi:hypothetical protein
MVREITKGAAVATAVFALLAGSASAEDKGKMDKSGKEGGATVQCSGINGCKGQGACHSAANSCKGENACKGKGWVEAKSEKECKDKGGKVVASK